MGVAGFPRVKPVRQLPLLDCKLKPHHQRWILAAFGDSGFTLMVKEVGLDGIALTKCTYKGVSYADLFCAIKSLSLSKGKWWIAGWRTRYALEMAKLLAALESGEVRLPMSRGTKSKGQPAGSVTLTDTIVNVDLAIGRHKVKFIDLANLGVHPEQFGAKLATLTIEDVERAFGGYLGMCTLTGLSASRVTAAQTGWVRFRARHLPAFLSINLSDESRVLERRACYNGRTECFKLGDIPDKVYSLDVKSCYAHICATQELPVHLDTEYPLGLPVGEIDSAEHVQWIADCVIRTEVADYPLRWGEQPIYPIGEFHTTLCWPELKHAMDRGRVVKVTRAARYIARPALRSYAKWFLYSKDSLVLANYQDMLPTLKSIFNASLGYSARRKYTWLAWNPHGAPDWWLGVTQAPDRSCEVVQAQVLDGSARWLQIAGEPYEAIPYLHATICSWARVKLVGIMDAAGRENVLYCDTDGILVTRPGWEALNHAEGLLGVSPGQLVERFPPGRCRIGGQKNYRIGNRYVCAGGIQTRRSLMADKIVLATPTGRTDVHGNVEPFRFRTEDVGDEKARWRNELA